MCTFFFFFFNRWDQPNHAVLPPLRGILTPGVAVTTHLSILIYQRCAKLTPLSDLLNFLKDPLQVVKRA